MLKEKHRSWPTKQVKNMKNQEKLSALKPKRLHVKCKRAWNVLFISTLVAWMTTACASSTKLVIPANLKTPCPDLLELKSGQAKEVLQVMVDDRRKYVDCKQRHAAIIEIVAKSSK